ncbi:MAG TPA: retropepsin-like aspartic protease [Sedimentisphaerales bacterium]|nr:retropepsin-like aspartic protease [Sedimentisphaerales bacterium]
MNLAFDTAGQGALFTTEKIWKQTQKRLHKVKKSIKSVFAPFAGGNIRSRVVTVKELNVGDRIVKNAFVAIVPNDTSIFESMKNQEGLLGMQCFADTTVVLDFERDVMWVKNNRAP